MEYRDLNVHDLVELEKNAQFPLDFLINKPKIIEKALEDEKGLAGAVIVSGTVEVSIILNNSRSKRDRIEAIRQLSDVLYRELTTRGYRDAHVFITDPKYADILIKHFGFERVVGQALVRRR